ncbi:MAG: T9SS type A sorting domain-containing protein [Bacteroidales bacterium]|nr:T9SS type A sorting domain-containing protein [Bacteroidales bacterium]
MEQLIPEREYNPAVHQPDPEPEAINGVYGRLPISVYPNPTDGATTITSPEAIKELTVTDLAGRVLLHQSSLGSTTTLDTAPLEPGLYLLKVTTASGTATTKLAVR